VGENRGIPKDIDYESIDYERPSAARIYDHLLGGYHNFEIDRKVAAQLAEIMPDFPLYVQANRAFLPTVGNVHEIAQRINPLARVVYVDNDPVAVRHSRTILEDNPNAIAVRADIRQPEVILDRPEVRNLLDLSKPTAALLVSVLLFIVDDEEAYRLVRVLRNALAPGSYIAISHATAEGVSPEQAAQGEKLYAASGNPVRLRSHVEIKRFFEGFELVEPGLVLVPLWRPDGPDELFFDQPELSQNQGGVAYKP
jgi:hypothetical protein